MKKISKYASIINRMGQQFFDRRLAKHRIGSGQQFFLLEIANEPGITVQELARKGHFDNGSATRAAQKLEQEGYIEIMPDTHDRRIRRMYVTSRAAELIADTFAAKDQWYGILLDGLTDQEVDVANGLMQRIAQNAISFIKGERDESEDEQGGSR